MPFTFKSFLLVIVSAHLALPAHAQANLWNIYSLSTNTDITPSTTGGSETVSARNPNANDDLAQTQDPFNEPVIEPTANNNDISLNDSNKKTSQFFRFTSPVKRKYILFPALGSFVLPGLDQWATSQFSSASFYTGYAFAGYYSAAWMQDKIDQEGIPNPETEDEALPLDSNRQFLSVAGQATLAAGFLSAYHSFRTYAEVSGDNRYEFVKNSGDTMENIMLAPFKFKFLKRPTTYWPLLLGLALVLAGDNKPRDMNSSDYGFTLATSYQAGVAEEAFFRGFLYPYLTVTTGSNFWGNTLSSGIFGALHISSENPFPLFQTAFGMYDAYVTKKNNWSIQESIFVHFWWDVIVIGAALAYETENRIHHRKTLLNITF